MKKILVTLLLIATVLPLAGKGARVPKHEFSVGGGDGVSFWSISSPENLTEFRSELTSLHTLEMGFGYTWHITPNWGLTTGVNIFTVDGMHYEYRGEVASLKLLEYGWEYTAFRSSELEGDASWEHRSDILPYESAIGIPLMVQYNLPLKGAFHFYTAAGARLGIISKAGAEITGHFSEKRIVKNYNNPAFFSDTGWKKIDTETDKDTRSKDADFNRLEMSAVLEAGLRIPIWNVIGVCVSLYGSMGLTPIFPLTGGEMITETETLYYIQSPANASRIPVYDEENYRVTPGADEHYMKLRPFTLGLRARLVF